MKEGNVLRLTDETRQLLGTRTSGLSQSDQLRLAADLLELREPEPVLALILVRAVVSDMAARALLDFVTPKEGGRS